MKTIETICHKSGEQNLQSEERGPPPGLRRTGSVRTRLTRASGGSECTCSPREINPDPSYWETERKAVLYLGWKIKVD